MGDFGKNKTVTPTHYTLRHGGNYRADSLRTWDLQVYISEHAITQGFGGWK